MLFANVVMGIVAESINKYWCSLAVDAKPELIFKSVRGTPSQAFPDGGHFQGANFVFDKRARMRAVRCHAWLWLATALWYIMGSRFRGQPEFGHAA